VFGGKHLPIIDNDPDDDFALTASELEPHALRSARFILAGGKLQARLRPQYLSRQPAC
jgi:hypothetical protein